MTKSKAEQAAPKTIEAATELLEIYAVNAGLLAKVEADRAAALAATNAVADGLAAPLLRHQAELFAQIEPWWAKHGSKLTLGKRKSIELGGCIVGSKASAASLTHSYDDDKQAGAVLNGMRWAKPFVRISYAPEKAAIKGAIERDDRLGRNLKSVGFAIKPGVETFFVERVKQEGVVETR